MNDLIVMLKRARLDLNTAYPNQAELADLCDEAATEIERLTEELENERARGIHTCGPNCRRPMCVLRRENERLTAENSRLSDEVREARTAYGRQFNAINKALSHLDGARTATNLDDFEEATAQINAAMEVLAMSDSRFHDDSASDKQTAEGRQ